MSTVPRDEFDVVVAQVAAMNDLVATSVVPKLDQTIGLLSRLGVRPVSEQLVDSLDERLGSIDQRLTRMDGRLAAIEHKLDEILRRLPAG